MKFRSTIRIERNYWDWIKMIYPIYGAKSLSAFIEGILFFFCYGDNPSGINIRKLFTDALEGKVLNEGKVCANNPVVVQQDKIKSDFMEFIAETYEGTMLNLLCSDGDDFIKKRSMLALNIQTQFSNTYEHTLTDSELRELVALWCDAVKANGKYREAYAEYNALRLAKERAQMEDY